MHITSTQRHGCCDLRCSRTVYFPWEVNATESGRILSWSRFVLSTKMDDNFDKLTFRSFDANLTKNYTVENKKGIEEKRHEDDPCENFWLSVTKWLVAVLLSVTVLFCVALSKVLLFVLGQQYRDLQPREVISPRNVTNSTRAYSPPARAESRDASRESLFIMLVLVLMIPQLVSFVLAMWKSLRPHSHPWPSSKAVLLVSSSKSAG